MKLLLKMGDHLKATAFLILQTMIYLSIFTQASVGQANCDLFKGTWVVDDSLPLYQTTACPFMEDSFNCAPRPDKMYLKYAWKPHACDLPRFDGKKFLQKWRGKKILFVGDSVTRNQWKSLACMLHASIPDSKPTTTNNGNITSINFLDFQLSVSLYQTPYLVDIIQKSKGKVLDLDSIKQGDEWRGMDMLIFNTWHWWTHSGATAQGWDIVKSGTTESTTMDKYETYPKGLTTWGKWVDSNVDMAKTKVLFQGIAPVHFDSKEWNATTKKCKGIERPLKGSTYPAGLPKEVDIVKTVLKGMKTKVLLLDITTLSQLRVDAHPSTFMASKSGSDCSHWCLPGLPDTWNQIMAALI